MDIREFRRFYQVIPEAIMRLLAAPEELLPIRAEAEVFPIIAEASRRAMEAEAEAERALALATITEELEPLEFALSRSFALSDGLFG